MWDPRRLTTLWASTACYRDSFGFLLPFTPYREPERSLLYLYEPVHSPYEEPEYPLHTFPVYFRKFLTDRLLTCSCAKRQGGNSCQYASERKPDGLQRRYECCGEGRSCSRYLQNLQSANLTINTVLPPIPTSSKCYFSFSALRPKFFYTFLI
jgi:hypothetical protein